jgi:RNA polymerase sigma factor (sigma-70 family)
MAQPGGKCPSSTLFDPQHGLSPGGQTDRKGVRPQQRTPSAGKGQWHPMRLTDSDGAHVRACLAGDRAAWEALIRRYERLIYSIPLRCGLSGEDAADVFQTVCVKLFESLEHLRDQEHLARWLMTTTARESWRVRKQNRLQAPLPDAGADQPAHSSQDDLPAPGPLPQETIIRLEEEQMVRQAMQQLGERCRTMLGLLYFTDPAPSYAQIAQRFGMPEGSVGPTRARCLQQLRKILERMGF